MNSFNYFRALAARHPPLQLEEERALMRAAANRDRPDESARAIDRLVLHNLRHALDLAWWAFGAHPAVINDAVSAAVESLIKAANRVEDQGKPFSAYANVIIRGDLTEFSQRLPIVRVTRYARARLKQGRPDPAAKTALEEPVLSLDGPAGGGETGQTLLETLPAAQEGVADAAMKHLDVQDVLEHATPQVQTVLKSRFGLEGEAPMERRKIGDRLGLSGSRVEQIEREGLRAARNYLARRPAARA
ncbi:MAG: sigma-70 family RNA polymerase sigma factor [Opitutaceae bacterium]|nr:sigma-70 family RNA polymerase sigma factor [Opitutaceae bacterium]